MSDETLVLRPFLQQVFRTRSFDNGLVRKVAKISGVDRKTVEEILTLLATRDFWVTEAEKELKEARDARRGCLVP